MKNETIFKPEQFTPTQWSTAVEKAQFANRFMTFVESGFKRHYFTKAFYNQLSNMFGHIAHYNQLGFWDVWFDSDIKQLQFIENVLLAQCYGDASYTYSDVEKELQKEVKARGVLARLAQTVRERIEQAERAELERLERKYRT